jgi:hypothetical protein
MPRVRLLVPLNINNQHLTRGAVVDVPGDLASSLVRLGRVELVRGEQPETPESAAIEKSVRRRGGKR